MKKIVNGKYQRENKGTFPRVLIAGASPDRINNNSILRRHVANGFRSVMGDRNVMECQFESAADLATRSLPSMILCFGSCMPDVSSYFELRKVCDKFKIKLVFWMHDDPYEFDFSYKVESVADLIFSNDKWATAHYSHPNVYHLPLAACPSYHYRKWSPIKNNDLFFCGVGFSNRVAILEDLSKYIKNVKANIIGDAWPNKFKLAKNIKLENSELASAYSNSIVTLNMGRHFNLANSRFQLTPSTPGPRTFEAAMAGTVQFYFVESLEVIDYFTPGKEIILFNDPIDFHEQFQNILDNQTLSKNIALAAQKRALKDHTYESRAKYLLEKCFLS